MKSVFIVITSFLLIAFHFCQAEESLWEGNRLTADQPFPAEVIGIAQSWVGYELLLKEIDVKEPRYCYTNVATTFSLKYTLTTKKASEKLLINAPTSKWIMLTKAIPIGEFNYSGGAYKLGKKYGNDDLLLKVIANRRSEKKGGADPPAKAVESKPKGKEEPKPR